MDSELRAERNDSPKRGQGLSGSTLKLIAIVTMLVDHVGAVVLIRVLLNLGGGALSTDVLLTHRGLFFAYMITRFIGRLAFPVFCFLMVEGFQRTRNKWKYAMRMGIFALISEIPFDLAFSGRVLEFQYQNIYFTLFLGLMAMILTDLIERKVKPGTNRAVNAGIRYGLILLNVILFYLAAEWMHTDYAGRGVLCIMVLYLFRKTKWVQITAGAAAFLWEIPAPLALIPVAFYNGKRGLKLKYVFYLFYPVHLLALYLICVYMGIGGIPAV